jgi:hypothetical protein
MTFPLYLTAIQTALPKQYLGVATSQIQFWRNLGGTVGSAILGAVLANRLPDYLKTRVTELHLPPEASAGLPKVANPNAILDPALMAKLPAAFIHAIRLALSDTLHDIYLIAGLVLVIALVSTIFLREVPLRGAKVGSGGSEARPPDELDAKEEREPAAATA